METNMLQGKTTKGFNRNRYVLLGTVILVGVILLLLAFIYRNGQVVATVNGENIGKEELYQAMLENSGRDILDRLILKRLVLQEGEKMGVAVGEAEIDQEVGRIIQDSFLGMEDYFKQALRDYGVSEEKVREELRVELVLRKIAESRLEITEEDERSYFAANQASFNIPEQIEARHILVETREEAEEMLNKLDKGADFAELAGEFSKDAVSARQGGNLGFFGRGMMVPEFDEAAFSLAAGQRSGIVETEFGFHIIEVLNRQEGRTVDFGEVRDTVREKLTKELLSQKMSQLVDSIWEEAEIDYRI